MKILKLHKWDIPIGKAKLLQTELASKVSQVSVFKDLSEIKKIAACDIAYSKSGDKTYAVILVYDFPELKLVERKVQVKKVKGLFPYVPGYLSFREAPVLLELFRKIESNPDIVMIDGQGIAHPRGLGLASHLGLFLDVPTLGCAKSLLYGKTSEPPPGLDGAYTFIKNDTGDIIGMNLRTKRNTKSVYVSVGHKINLEIATDIIMSAKSRYRIPEPLRQADIETKNLKKL